MSASKTEKGELCSAFSLMRTLFTADSVPFFFEFVHGDAGSSELFSHVRCIGTRLFLEFQCDWQIFVVCALQDGNGALPIDRAFIRWQVLIFFAVIVVQVHAGDQFAY